ncbi:protochlorophyllide oxidoreductase [Allochromatium palmeri]|uniref:Protochlorophyllide oxidoreductase n=1 Tax=Allochromatium palmeri TaxID=231048 RepID=A0A6N8E5Z1_9GAMM|nr:protochlorophyllide oxidoreductase [Allochromatium palmeri]MTW19535.1 protochlorophyllide oxidoreductase [Allochromatium palmeri]
MEHMIEAESALESTPWALHERLFLDRLGARLEREDFSEYSARRCASGKQVFNHTRVYQGEKLDRVMVSRYSLRLGRWGLVIFAYPRLDYDLPAFLLHVGGQPPERTLLTLDLAPCSSTLDLESFARVAREHRAALELPDERLPLLESVTSPHLLHCTFKPLDPERFLAAFDAVVETWCRYIDQAVPDPDTKSKQARSDRVLELKRVIFENDPAFPVFTQSFGKSMSETLAEAAFGGTPGLATSDFQDVPPPAVGSWANKKLGLIWSAEAQKRVGEAPVIIRPMIRRLIEKEAAKDKLDRITVEFVKHCEQKYWTRGGEA